MRALYLVSNMRKNNIKDKVHNIICPLFPVISQIQHETCINIHPTKKHFSHFPTPSRNEFVDLKKNKSPETSAFSSLHHRSKSFVAKRQEVLASESHLKDVRGCRQKMAKASDLRLVTPRYFLGKRKSMFFLRGFLKEIKCVCEDILNF